MSNNNSKTALIKTLALKLRAKGHVVVECEGDADRTMKNVKVMLWSLWKKSKLRERGNLQLSLLMTLTFLLCWFICGTRPWVIYFCVTKLGKASKKNLEIISIKNVASSLPTHVKENLLCIHAWGGCDTTSALFSQRKTAVLKFVESNCDFARHLYSVFQDPFATQDKVSSVGIKVAKNMYGMYKIGAL